MVMVDANYAPVRDAYIAARSRALDAILHAVAPETPQAASLSAMAPDALERVVAGWNRRLRALALLALRCEISSVGVSINPDHGQEQTRPHMLGLGAGICAALVTAYNFPANIHAHKCTHVCCLSERRLAVSIWPEPECEELYMQLTVRYLRQLAQAGRDIIEARRVPEKVGVLPCREPLRRRSRRSALDDVFPCALTQLEPLCTRPAPSGVCTA